jgi:hypothetical protein
MTLLLAGDNKTAVAFGLAAALQSVVLLVVCHTPSLNLSPLIRLPILFKAKRKTKTEYATTLLPTPQAAALLTLPIPGVDLPEWMNVPVPEEESPVVTVLFAGIPCIWLLAFTFFKPARKFYRLCLRIKASCLRCKAKVIDWRRKQGKSKVIERSATYKLGASNLEVHKQSIPEAQDDEEDKESGVLDKFALAGKRMTSRNITFLQPLPKKGPTRNITLHYPLLLVSPTSGDAENTVSSSNPPLQAPLQFDAKPPVSRHNSKFKKDKKKEKSRKHRRRDSATSRPSSATTIPTTSTPAVPTTIATIERKGTIHVAPVPTIPTIPTVPTIPNITPANTTAAAVSEATPTTIMRKGKVTLQPLAPFG